ERRGHPQARVTADLSQLRRATARCGLPRQGADTEPARRSSTADAAVHGSRWARVHAAGEPADLEKSAVRARCEHPAARDRTVVQRGGVLAIGALPQQTRRASAIE